MSRGKHPDDAGLVSIAAHTLALDRSEEVNVCAVVLFCRPERRSTDAKLSPGVEHAQEAYLVSGDDIRP